MKKEIIESVTKDGKPYMRITTSDERWYVRDDQFVPSVTWICGYYPKGTQFYKWLAEKGWDESQAIKQAAGDKGSKVHYAIEDLVKGETVKMDAKYINPTTGEQEELTKEEYECLMAFSDWFKETKPKVVESEIVVFGDGFAGTIDLVCEIDGTLWIIDYKTGQNIWSEYELQLSAYKNAYRGQNEPNLAILQIGYKKNKRGWKFTEIQDKFNLFLAAKQIWANEAEKVQPKVKDYPEELKLNIEKHESTKEN